MSPDRYTDDVDDEGAPPRAYRDNDLIDVDPEDAVVVDRAEASATAEPPHHHDHVNHQDHNHVNHHDYLSQYIPPQLHHTWIQVKTWVKGPQPPRPWKIDPWFPKIQEAPSRIVDSFCPKRKHKILLFVVFYAAWILSFSLVLKKSAFSAEIPGHGAPVRIRCSQRFWNDANGCGLNGDACRPFQNTSMPFRCPANCRRVQLMNPHAVGKYVANYQQLIVGGPTDEAATLENTYYRADSFICGAAIHAGFINDATGGCGVVSMVGEKSSYPAVNRNHIKSIGFDSYFPKSFSFLPGSSAQCRDLRWPLLGISVTFSILLSLFTSSPAVFFPSVFVAIFFHVALASDPPSLADYYALVSICLGRLLPACFCMYVVYRFAVYRTLVNLAAPFDKTLFWLGGCWVGALNNYTFDKIPIERLTPHDIQNEPGAVPALIIVVLSLFSIALLQSWCLRIEGRLPRYLAIYGIFVGSLLLLVAVPKMNLRIHHYILGLLLVFGTSMQTRPSLLFQGILIGLFINGIARWGFDSILQTPDELRGDGPISSLLPVVSAPIIYNNIHSALKPNITFEWPLPFPKPYDGLSILVNDVERYRGYADTDTLSWTWVKHLPDAPEYFRFAYLDGGNRGDYTKAGTWGKEGGWKKMKSGPS